MQSNFESKSTWSNVRFGSHPRSIVHGDYSRLVQLDTRLNNASNIVELYDVRKLSNELIEYNLALKPYYTTHLLCCTKTMLLIDERFTKVPLLSWKHDLTSESLLNIKQIHVNQFDADLIVCCDLKNILVYNLAMSFNNSPVLFNTALKIDTFRDIESYLPVDYDKTLKYHLDYRLNKPILGFSAITDCSNFAIFQVSRTF
jgi:hypothetical protein